MEENVKMTTNEMTTIKSREYVSAKVIYIHEENRMYVKVLLKNSIRILEKDSLFTVRFLWILHLYVLKDF